jgi:hypothetical protein
LHRRILVERVDVGVALFGMIAILSEAIMHEVVRFVRAKPRRGLENQSHLSWCSAPLRQFSLVEHKQLFVADVDAHLVSRPSVFAPSSSDRRRPTEGVRHEASEGGFGDILRQRSRTGLSFP